MAISFTEEAEKIIKSYLDEVSREIDEMGFEMSDERRKDFLLAIMHSFRLFSFRKARKRGSEVIQDDDVRSSIRFVRPKMLIRHSLRDPETFSYVERIRRKHFEMIKKRLESSRRPRLLDAGCEYGRQMMEYIRRGWDAEFIGIDIDLEALEYGRWAEPSISFTGADVASLPFRSGTFDVVICIGTLHLIGDIEGVIMEFSRVLKEGGLLFITQFFTTKKLISSASTMLWKLFPKIGVLHQRSDVERILHDSFSRVVMDRAYTLPISLAHVYFCTSIK